MKKIFMAWRIFGKSEEDKAFNAAHQPLREELASAGLDEETLRKMDPDDRVAALEKARLDIFLSELAAGEVSTADGAGAATGTILIGDQGRGAVQVVVVALALSQLFLGDGELELRQTLLQQLILLTAQPVTSLGQRLLIGDHTLAHKSVGGETHGIAVHVVHTDFLLFDLNYA